MTKVKICGITNLEDARLAVSLGADMLGFNFFPGSKRFVGHRAKQITPRLPKAVTTVGIFVDQDIDEIIRAVETAQLDLIQLHGDETPVFVAEVGTRLPTSVEIIKAFRVGPDFDVRLTQKYPVNHILLDSLSETGDRGGTGETFDWTIVNSLPVSASVLFLAGGLNPLNVAGAIQTVCPFAVDVASGVESAPGKKDPDKMAAFIRNAKNA
jgi:phosphoribosylanthranilate isomerase